MGWDPLTNVLRNNKIPSPIASYHDPITSIQEMIENLPITWHWHHVARHQDNQVSMVLNQWAKLNIRMNLEAKKICQEIRESY